MSSTNKFTVENSAQDVSSQDTIVCIQNQSISALCITSTDKLSILHITSGHLTFLKKGLPFFHFVGLKHICASLEDFKHEAQNMYIDFQQRADPTNWHDAALEKVRDMDVSQPSFHNLVEKGSVV